MKKGSTHSHLTVSLCWLCSQICDTYSVPSSLCCLWEDARCGWDLCQVSCGIPCSGWPCWMLSCRSRTPYAAAPASTRSPCTPRRGPGPQLPTSCACGSPHCAGASWPVCGLRSGWWDEGDRVNGCKWCNVIAAHTFLSLCWGWKIPLTVCGSVVPSGQSADLACLRFGASQWCPLVAQAVCARFCGAGGVSVALLWAFTCKKQRRESL